MARGRWVPMDVCDCGELVGPVESLDPDTGYRGVEYRCANGHMGLEVWIEDLEADDLEGEDGLHC